MWLLKHEVAEEMRRAWKRGEMPTAEQRAEHIRRHEAESANGPRNLQVAGDTAEIAIDGVLTEKPDFWAWLLGGGNTTYRDIRSALAIASQDPAIKKVILNISSPGGTVAGLFDTLAVLEAFPKPISVRASLAASAAYSIAAVAGVIQATNPAAEFGSIGVAVTYFHTDELIDITSSNAPKKRPDPSTEEGKAVIREHLDAIHDLFVDAIARGRSRTLGETLTKDVVNETFGRGAVLLAGESKKRRMIDKAPPPAPRGARSALVTRELERRGWRDLDSEDNAVREEGRAAPASAVRAYESPVAQGLMTPDRATAAMMPGMGMDHSNLPKVGDRVRVVGTPHMPDHDEGIVRQVIDGALGIEFDAMPGEVHHWYVASEVMVIESADEPMDPMNSSARRGAPALARAREVTPVAAGEPEETATGGEETTMAEPKTEMKPMDLKTLKAQHPEAYEAAVAEGRDAERKRCLAHLKLGEASGATKVAHDAIASGVSTMDELVSAEYQAAAMNRRDTKAAQADSDAAGAAVDGAKPKESAKPRIEQVADALERLRNGEDEATAAE